MTEGAVSLSEAAYTQLRASIVRCDIAPGSWITERQVTATIGFGLAPVRAAMARLRHEGLIEALPRVGYRVASLTVSDVEDLFDVWSLIAPAIVERAHERVSDEQIDQLESATSALLEAMADEPDDVRQIGLAKLIFGCYAEVAGSKRLAAIYDRLQSDIDRCFSIVAVQAPHGLLLVDNRHAAFDRLRGRDAATAADETRTFIEGARRVVLDVLQTLPGGTPAARPSLVS